MMDKFDYVIYHKGCLDGFSGFFVAHLSGRIDKNAEIYPDFPSATQIPPGIEGKDVLIIDVAYKKEVLDIIFNDAQSVVFIDHHVSIKDDVIELKKKYSDKNIQIVYDEERCGATLSWIYFFSRQEVPLFLKYVEDQDTGKWIHENTKPFIFAIRTYYNLNHQKKTLNHWFKLLDKENVGKLIKKGKHMKRYNDHLVNINVPKHSLERFPSRKIYALAPQLFKKPGQYQVAVFCGLNCPSVTDLGVAALEQIKCDFCIMWVYNLDSKKYVMSMRSKKVDVSEICKIFGGGGHRLAAACSFFAKDHRIEDMFETNSLPRSAGFISPMNPVNPMIPTKQSND